MVSAICHNAEVLKNAIATNKPTDHLLKGKVLASVFYEPSTRTSASFNVAMQRLGGRVVGIDEVSSSARKGESLEDAIKVLSSYVDCLVLRHPGQGMVERVASKSCRPIINAGDGIGEHPTQALLDVFTIRNEIGTCNNLTITMVGDLKHGRTVHSLARLLTLYEGVNFRFVSPPNLSMPEEVKRSLQGCKFQEFKTIEEAIPETDVLYVTRIQRERFAGQEEAYREACTNYAINPSTLFGAKDELKILHPLPRLHEIDVRVDNDQRAAYFRQAENGLYVRMALLCMVLQQ